MYPCSSRSVRRILQSLMSTLSGAAWIRNASSWLPFMPYFRVYAGERLWLCPGTGCPGVPRTLARRSDDHCWSSVIGLTVMARNTPLSLPMKCSPVRGSEPSQMPSLHRSSHFPGISFVLGIMKLRFSPNSKSFVLDRLPFIIWNAVRPDGLTLQRVIR